MTRAALAAGLLLGALALTAGAPSASAYCDPKYAPLCTNDCQMYYVNHPKEALADPVAAVSPRICPD